MITSDYVLGEDSDTRVVFSLVTSYTKNMSRVTWRVAHVTGKRALHSNTRGSKGDVCRPSRRNPLFLGWGPENMVMRHQIEPLLKNLI